MATMGSVKETGHAKVALARVSGRKIDRSHHDEVVISVRAGDWVEWTCATVDSKVEKFEVGDFKLLCAHETKCAHPSFPFEGPERSFTGRRGELVASGPVRREAVGHTYKFTWRVFESAVVGKAVDTWDPHLRVDP